MKSFRTSLRSARLALLCLGLICSPAASLHAQSETPTTVPPAAPSTVLKAVFQTTAGVIENVGTGFFMEVPERGTVFVTALHVFGPPGGLPGWISSSDLPEVVESATLTDAFTSEPAGRVVGGILTPGASLPTEEDGEDGQDFAVFRIADSLRAGLVPAVTSDQDLWIVSPGLPGGAAFPVTRVTGTSPYVSVSIPEDLSLPFGISGSPIVTAEGDVVALVVMLGTGPNGERVVHGTPIEAVVQALSG